MTYLLPAETKKARPMATKLVMMTVFILMVMENRCCLVVCGELFVLWFLDETICFDVELLFVSVVVRLLDPGNEPSVPSYTRCPAPSSNLTLIIRLI